MQQIVFEEEVVKDSLLVTPIGICLNFYEQSNNFIFVNFNETRIKIYDNNKLTVADAAMQAQFPNDGLFPKRGSALNFTVNGKQKMARGQLGEAAVITVNGEPADINTPIHANDMIKVVESTAGEPGHMTIGELPEITETLGIFVNEKKVEVPKFASVGKVLQSGYYEIQEGDEIEILNYYTVSQIVEFMDVILDPHMNVYVNNMLADQDTPVYENFSVVWTLENIPNSTDTYLNSEDAYPEAEDAYPEAKDEKLLHLMVNQQPVTLKGKSEYVFVDVFEEIDFDLTKPKGKGIVTNLNGKPAQYMEPLHEGDIIEIYWN